jgi:serine/threonine protein kinase
VKEFADTVARLINRGAGADQIQSEIGEFLARFPEARRAATEWLQAELASGPVPISLQTALGEALRQIQGNTTAGRDVGVADDTIARLVGTDDRRTPSLVPSGAAEGGTQLCPGAVIKDRYALVSELGRGGMGVVFKARDRNREKAKDRNPFVALKVLGEDFKKHPDAFMALEREARRAQSLAHPNVITVYDFDYDDRYTFMPMEYLEGIPLDAWLRTDEMKSATNTERWSLVSSIGAALTYAHKKGVVHSDLKPSNIFMCDNGDVKVLDFGISRPMRIASGGQTETLFDPAKRLGSLTPSYASLEQWTDNAPDPRDDVYSFGCVTYEIYGGCHPFANASAKQAFESGLEPRRIVNLSRRQWDALRGALAFKRDSRTASVASVLQQMAPETFLHKYRLTLGVTVLVLFVIGGYTGWNVARDYIEMQTLGSESPDEDVDSPPRVLTTKQRHDVEDALVLASDTLEQAKGSASPDDLMYLFSEGANNLRQILSSITAIDPSNAKAQALELQAAQIYFTSAQRQHESEQDEKAALLADRGLQMLPASRASQVMELKRDMLQLKAAVCAANPTICAKQ